jgi:anti-sigma factor (TIGR02949 family)
MGIFMDCKAVQNIIFRYLYGESSADELRHIKTHLDRCRECRAESDIIADILERLRAGLPEDPVPEGFKERMLARIAAAAASAE